MRYQVNIDAKTEDVMLLWLHNKSRLPSEVKWFGIFIGVYMINGTIHGRLEIRNFKLF